MCSLAHVDGSLDVAKINWSLDVAKINWSLDFAKINWSLDFAKINWRALFIVTVLVVFFVLGFHIFPLITPTGHETFRF